MSMYINWTLRSARVKNE